MPQAQITTVFSTYMTFQVRTPSPSQVSPDRAEGAICTVRMEPEHGLVHAVAISNQASDVLSGILKLQGNQSLDMLLHVREAVLKLSRDEQTRVKTFAVQLQAFCQEAITGLSSPQVEPRY